MDFASLKSAITGLVDRINRMIACRKVIEAKSFSETRDREEAFDARNLGIRQVPLGRIVGSVGRYHDFDSRFRIKEHVPREKIESVRKAMREGKALPPVRIYQIKDEYYVLDGNHRVAAAIELGRDEIDADIVEFIPTRNTLENILYREKAEFRETTGLPHPIELTEVGQYAYLMRQISAHRTLLAEEKQGEVSIRVAAGDWYKTVYSPLVGIIKKGRLDASFPERTIADLYAYISYHQWEKGSERKYGSGIDRLISNSMEEFRKIMSDKKEFEYPEMKREITAFVLMKVDGKKENRVLEKLHELDEIREVHSVHGHYDVLLKIVLTRDLVSSDAEIIGSFVHDSVRQIPGVLSTETLIPGRSMIR